MGYPPSWVNARNQNTVKVWEDKHPGFPWTKQFTDEEKKNWILSIPNNGPQPGVMWDNYNLLKFTAKLDSALLGAKTEFTITPLGRVRAVDRKEPMSTLRMVVVLEVLIDDAWVEVWSQPWNGNRFTKQYGMDDIPKQLLIESQMIDPAYIERYAWSGTPMAERYKDDILRAGGTIAWALNTLTSNTRGVVGKSVAIKPNIDDRGVLIGYEVNLDVEEFKVGYTIRRIWGGNQVVGPDGKVIQE